MASAQKSAPQKRKHDDKFCPHCNAVLSKTAYYSHRQKYRVNGEWQTNSLQVEGRGVNQGKESITTTAGIHDNLQGSGDSEKVYAPLPLHPPPLNTHRIQN